MYVLSNQESQLRAFGQYDSPNKPAPHHPRKLLHCLQIGHLCQMPQKFQIQNTTALQYMLKRLPRTLTHSLSSEQKTWSRTLRRKLYYSKICKSFPVYTGLQARSHFTVASPRKYLASLSSGEKEDGTIPEILTGILGNLGLQILKPESQNFNSV